MSSIKIGEKIPHFNLYDMDRKQRSVDEFKGKKLVLAFFPGAFTSTCKKEMCSLRDDLAKLEKLNAQVIGISVNDPFSQKAFHNENMLNFPLLCDYTRKITNLFDLVQYDFAGLKDYAVSKRSVFIVAADGTLRWKWISENPGVEPDYKEIINQLNNL